jgi:hypothetical protein
VNGDGDGPGRLRVNRRSQETAGDRSGEDASNSG